MESQDKEFEVFLKQFELRESRSPIPSEASEIVHERRGRLWLVAAAAVVVVALGGLMVRFTSSENTSAFKSGDQGLTLSLRDGSSIELHPQTNLSVETIGDEQRLRLERGSILVVAASRQTGSLRVVTRDAEVSVQGTIFLVETQPAGTRIGVIEGEVEVQSGAVAKRLLQGEQFSTDPAMKTQPLAEAIAWSRRAAEFTALLPTPPIVAFTPDPVERLVREETIPPPEPRRPVSVQEPPQDSPPAPAPAPAPAPREEPAPQNDSGADSAAVQILNKACGSCHVPDLVKNARFANRDAYAALVSRQVSMGASLTQAEFNILVDYLFRTYGARR